MPNYQKAYAAMAELVKKIKAPDPIDLVLKVGDCFSAITHNTPLGDFIKNVTFLRQIAKSGDLDVAPNPLFVANGLGEDADCSATASFQRREGITGIFTTLFKSAGTAAHGVTAGVDVGTAAVSGSAIGTSGAHIYKLVQIAKMYSKSETIQDWCKTLEIAKGLRIAVNAVSLAGAVIPYASLPTKIAGAVLSTGIKMTYSTTCSSVAAAIHWRAYQEQVISRNFGRTDINSRSIGPATRIFWEIFTRRGFTRVFGQDKIAQLIMEPSGWRALNYKVAQL